MSKRQDKHDHRRAAALERERIELAQHGTMYDEKTGSMWIGASPGGNHTEAVAAALVNAPASSVTVADVFHDDECAIFRDKPCNCHPEIRLGRVNG